MLKNVSCLSRRPSVLGYLWAVGTIACSCLAALQAAELEKIQEPPISQVDREHWSFQPLQRPPLPRVASAAGARNEVDLFIEAALDAAGLSRMPAADRVTLIRRVTFDLTGLPPTPDEVTRFCNDPSPAAYEQLVERLLASPRYGEHWGQRWLDLARFAESDGFEFDHVRREAWRYRDWVVDASNSDLPYDEFVRLQIAGDLLSPDEVSLPALMALRDGGTAAALDIATTFCLSGPDMPDINSQEERRDNLLNELTGTVGAVFLALQVQCAQCHDHKYDPISQADFYRLRAYFDPAVHVKHKESISVLEETVGKARAPSHLMVRGDWRRPGPVVHPAVPRVLDDPSPDRSAAENPHPRRQLAQWLTMPDHPLTSRVLANRIWQHHFGEGLSRSPSDFGVMGQPPSHPELLDWLATELTSNGWSIKHLHRLIVTSETYRQASRPAEPSWDEQQRQDAARAWQQLVQADPENKLLGRFPRRRLPGEAIRDAMLASGNLLLHEQGGPGVRPPLPDELVETLLKNQWDVTPDRAAHYRRSIYVFARRNLRYPIFEAFDRPDANASCPQRSESTTAPQALLLFNSEQTLEAAQAAAGAVYRQVPEAEQQITQLYRRILSREPNARERAEGLAFYRQQTELLRREGRSSDELAVPDVTRLEGPYAAAALTDVALGLLNCNEFLYLD